MLEGEFIDAVRTLVDSPSCGTPRTRAGSQIDVLNLSLGYYHETPEDELFARTLQRPAGAGAPRGCAVVCSAGNDATDRPTLPGGAVEVAGRGFRRRRARRTPRRHVSVGALNPNASVALFSNIGTG